MSSPEVDQGVNRDCEFSEPGEFTGRKFNADELQVPLPATTTVPPSTTTTAPTTTSSTVPETTTSITVPDTTTTTLLPPGPGNPGDGLP